MNENDVNAAQESLAQIRVPSQSLTNSKLIRSYRGASRRDVVFVLVLFVLSFFFVDAFLWAGAGLFMAVGFVGFYLTTRLYLRQDEKPTKYSLICGILLILGAASMVVSRDQTVRFFTGAALVVLATVVLEERMSLRTGDGLLFAVTDFFTTLIARTFGRFDHGIHALLYESSDSGLPKRRKTGSVLLGLIIAVPVLLVVVPLLISSDAAFEGLIDRLDPDLLGKLLISLLVSLVLVLCLFSQLFTVREKTKQARAASTFHGVEPALIGTVLTVLSLVYLVYLAAQSAYFFDGFRGLLPKDFTVAEYARRGFFEMCMIVAVNLLLVVLTVKLTAKREGKLPGWIRALVLFLVLFSMVIVCTAFSKMVLYIQRFGMTRLRILTSVFMLFLTVVLVFVGLELFMKKLPVLKIAVITAAICLIALGFVDVDRLVASYNVNAYRSGALSGLDIKTITELNDSAVPYLAQLMDDPDPKIRSSARFAMKKRLLQLCDEVRENNQVHYELLPYDFRSFDFSSYRARQILLETRDQFLVNETLIVP